MNVIRVLKLSTEQRYVIMPEEAPLTDYDLGYTVCAAHGASSDSPYVSLYGNVIDSDMTDGDFELFIEAIKQARKDCLNLREGRK